MILNAYHQLGDALLAALPTLNWVDLDTNQIANWDEANVPACPCVLIKFSRINWQTFGQGVQIGHGTLTLKLIVRSLAGTHLSDPLREENENGWALAAKLDGVSKPGFVGVRTESDHYPMGLYQVIEQTYEVTLSPDPPRFRTLPVTIKVNPVLINPVLIKPGTAQ